MSRTSSSAANQHRETQCTGGLQGRGLTFLVVVGLEELRAEKGLWKLALPSFNDKWFALLDDLVPDKLLELELPDLGGRNALGELKVGGPVNKSLQVQIRRYRIELCLGVFCGR